MGYLKQLTTVLQGRQQDVASGFHHIQLVEAQLAQVCINNN